MSIRNTLRPSGSGLNGDDEQRICNANHLAALATDKTLNRIIRRGPKDVWARHDPKTTVWQREETLKNEEENPNRNINK